MRGNEPFTRPAGGSEPPGPPARLTGAPRLYPLIRDEHAEDRGKRVSPSTLQPVMKVLFARAMDEEMKVQSHESPAWAAQQEDGRSWVHTLVPRWAAWPPGLWPLRPSAPRLCSEKSLAGWDLHQRAEELKSFLFYFHFCSEMDSSLVPGLGLGP